MVRREQRDRTMGQSKGFAFVEMARHDAVQEVNGRTIKVAETRPKRDNRGGEGDSRRNR
jgi:RNA recognition motif-containing protein